MSNNTNSDELNIFPKRTLEEKQKIVNAKDRYEEHPIHRVERVWNNLMLSHMETIVAGHALIEELSQLNTNSNYKALWNFVINSVDDETGISFREAYFFFLNRDVKRFINSAGEMFYHTEPMLHLEPVSYQEAFEEKVQEWFAGNEAGDFLSKIYNHFKHYQNPEWISDPVPENVEGMWRIVMKLDADELLRNEKLSSAQKKKLRGEFKNGLELLPLVEEYLRIFEGFWNWAIAEHIRVHEVDQEEKRILDKEWAEAASNGQLHSMTEVRLQAAEMIIKSAKKFTSDS